MATRSGLVRPGAPAVAGRTRRWVCPRRSSLSTLEHWGPARPPADRGRTCVSCPGGGKPGRARCGPGPRVDLHRLRAGMAAMVAALGGLDALVSTAAWASARALGAVGGICGARGTSAAPWTKGANTTAGWMLSSSAAGAAARSFVVAAREDLEIALGRRQVLGEAGRRTGPPGLTRPRRAFCDSRAPAGRCYKSFPRRRNVRVGRARLAHSGLRSCASTMVSVPR